MKTEVVDEEESSEESEDYRETEPEEKIQKR